MGIFVLLHLFVFGFAFIHYSLKDNLAGARSTFGITLVIARSAALVLHVDVALVLLRE